MAALADAPPESKPFLHTLYISPLRALAVDVRRNLEIPVAEMELPIRVAARTGDTPSARRTRQREKPPHILMTTPESLALLLSYDDSDRLFASLACINCHTVRGTPANGIFGPDLTHLMSRSTIGAGAAANTPERLRAWVDDPATIKPGALMPAMKLSRAEVDTLTAYLVTLK